MHAQALHCRALHALPHPAMCSGRNARAVRAPSLLWVLLALALGACSGPAERIAGPDARAAPLPIVTAPGAGGDARKAHRAFARALDEDFADHPDAALIEALRENLPQAALVAGNRVEILNDGPSTFAAFSAAIDAAEHHVHVETYIFADDEVGRRFVELLVAKRRAGVEVRVIYDAYGSYSTDPALFDELRAAGGQVVEYRPLEAVGHWLTGRVNNRDHRKLLIVDGRVAFVGGINISGTYASSSRARAGERDLDDGWRDAQVRIEGPVVRQFQALFLSALARAGGAALAPSQAYFPHLESVGSALVAAVASEYGHASQGAVHSAYVGAIAHAARRVWITQAYFAPDRTLQEALLAAAHKNVDVRILLPGFSTSFLTLHASRALYAELLAGGVRVYEYEQAFIHSKTAVMDDSVALVGSANLDFRSLLHNAEVLAVVIDVRVADEMAAWFKRDIEDATEIRPAPWRRRSLLQRLKEKAASLMWYWI